MYRNIFTSIVCNYPATEICRSVQTRISCPQKRKWRRLLFTKWPWSSWWRKVSPPRGVCALRDNSTIFRVLVVVSDCPSLLEHTASLTWRWCGSQPVPVDVPPTEQQNNKTISSRSFLIFQQVNTVFELLSRCSHNLSRDSYRYSSENVCI